MQRKEKHIKSDVGAECCTEPNGIHGPWGPVHSLCFYSIFCKDELHYIFLLGNTGWVFICLDKWNAEFEQNTTKNANRAATCRSHVAGEWTQKHVIATSTILTMALWGNLCRKKQSKINKLLICFCVKQSVNATFKPLDTGKCPRFM